MIIIRPIQKDEIPAARRVILAVAYNIYGWEKPFDEMIRHFETNGEFSDMDQVETQYFQNDCIFLVILDNEVVIGSGAVRKINNEIAELKRMWLLEKYHGKGIGYKVVTQLLDFARLRGYKKIYLQTGSEQSRAMGFYKRLGFEEIPAYNKKVGEISMSLNL